MLIIVCIQCYIICCLACRRKKSKDVVLEDITSPNTSEYTTFDAEPSAPAYFDEPPMRQPTTTGYEVVTFAEETPYFDEAPAGNKQ